MEWKATSRRNGTGARRDSILHYDVGRGGRMPMAGGREGWTGGGTGAWGVGGVMGGA